MIMRKFTYVLASVIISYLICVYEYNMWDFITGLEPSQTCERLLGYVLYCVIFYWAAKLLIMIK